MSHTPFGYRIENGKAVIDKEAAEQIKVLFQSYLSGDSLATAAKKAGIKASIQVSAGCYEIPDTSAMSFIRRLLTKTLSTLPRQNELCGRKDSAVPKVQTRKRDRLSYHLRMKEVTEEFDDPSGRRNTPTV